MQPVANSVTAVFECPRCSAQLPLSGFYNRAKDRRCKECCKVVAKERYHACATTREGVKYRNRVKLLQTYGLTMDDFENMLIAQQYMCKVCNAKLDLFAPAKQGNSACVDHDHATGQVRGLLCRCCNLALGYAQDRPDILRSLAHYLENANG